MRTSSLVCTMSLVLLVGPGCKEPSVSRSPEGVLFVGAHEASDTVERVVAPGTRKLILEGHTGDIILTTADADVARLSVTRRARADTPEQAQQKVPGLNIEEEGNEVAFRYRFGADSPETSRFDIVGEIPSATPLVVNWRSGAISVESFADNVEVRTVNGDVAFRGASPRIVLHTRNGDISATIEAFAQAVGPSSIELISANGDVSAAIPATANLRVEAQTSAGTIQSGSFPFVSEKFSPVGAGARFQARLGEGTGLLKLSTQHGAVSIGVHEGAAPEEAGPTSPPDTTESEAAVDLLPTVADTDAPAGMLQVPNAIEKADTVIAAPN